MNFGGNLLSLITKMTVFIVPPPKSCLIFRCKSFLSKIKKMSFSAKSTFRNVIKTQNQTMVKHAKTTLRKKNGPATFPLRMKSLLSDPQCISLYLEKKWEFQSRSIFSGKIVFDFQLFWTLYYDISCASSIRKCTFTLFRRQDFPACFYHCFEYLKGEVLLKDQIILKRNFKKTADWRVAFSKHTFVCWLFENSRIVSTRVQASGCCFSWVKIWSAIRCCRVKYHPFVSLSLDLH